MPLTQEDVLQAMPEGGLFAGKAWRASAEQFGVFSELLSGLAASRFSDQIRK